jgi:hypothetical protein
MNELFEAFRKAFPIRGQDISTLSVRADGSGQINDCYGITEFAFRSPAEGVYAIETWVLAHSYPWEQ